MDTATFFVAYSPSHPRWELGWDALVGIGTLALAAVTFWAERRRLRERHDELVKKNIAAANKAVFQLIRTHQTFADVQHQLVDPWRDDRGRHFMIRPLVADLKPIAIDFDGKRTAWAR